MEPPSCVLWALCLHSWEEARDLTSQSLYRTLLGGDTSFSLSSLS